MTDLLEILSVLGFLAIPAVFFIRERIRQKRLLEKEIKDAHDMLDVVNESFKRDHEKRMKSLGLEDPHYEARKNWNGVMQRSEPERKQNSTSPARSSYDDEISSRRSSGYDPDPSPYLWSGTSYESDSRNDDSSSSSSPDFGGGDFGGGGSGDDY